MIYITLFISCSQNQKPNTIKENVTVTKEIRKIASNVDDNFTTFLQTFSQDSIFQITRVKFPLKTTQWEDPETGVVTNLLGVTEYSALDFTYPKDALTRKYDRYTQKINITENSCVVQIRGIDNGIFTDFFFEKLSGKWFLVSWDEKST